MKYKSTKGNELITIAYGSHLYGTNTETSDFDFKVVYLPLYSDLLLCKKQHVERFRFTAEGEVVPDDNPMPENGYEADHIPIQKLVGDFLSGQAYAMEFVFAVASNRHREYRSEAFSDSAYLDTANLCIELASTCLHQDLYGMIGFAVKQTFDYVHRGERYLIAVNALKEIDAVLADNVKLEKTNGRALRLDHELNGVKVIDLIANRANLELGTSTNGEDKVLQTLKLNGREYLETTAVSHLRAAIDKLVENYGDRSINAFKNTVDWKSLSHAVRVYQQVIELLEDRWITFPRPNTSELLAIRRGEIPFDKVTTMLKTLDEKTHTLLETTKLPKSKDVRDRAEYLLTNMLTDLYA